jgi:hypothetical protein
VVRLCIPALEGAESEKAGIARGTLSVIPSITAIAIEAGLVNARIYKLQFKLERAGLSPHCANMLADRQKQKWQSAICEAEPISRVRLEARLLLRSCVVSWSLWFAEPILLPGGKELATLPEAIAYEGTAGRGALPDFDQKNFHPELAKHGCQSYRPHLVFALAAVLAEQFSGVPGWQSAESINF